MRERYYVDISLLCSGRTAIYNAYLTSKKHEDRLHRLIEDIYCENNSDQICEGRNFLIIEVGGEDITEGCDFSMPPIRY